MADHLADLLAPDAPDAPEPGSAATPAASVGTLAAAYVDLVVGGDRTEAVALVRGAVTAGMDASAVLVDVLEPAQREVGRRWAAGLISVVQEHFCTAVTQLVMTELYAGTVSGAVRGRRLVAVHAPGSRHHVGLRMVTDVLDAQGWSTTYVGTDVSVEALLHLLTADEADLLLVSASMPDQVPRLAAMVRAVHDDPRTRGVKVVVGGRPFLVAPDLVAVVGADAWARDARAAGDVCRQLVGSPRGRP